MKFRIQWDAVLVGKEEVEAPNLELAIMETERRFETGQLTGTQEDEINCEEDS